MIFSRPPPRSSCSGLVALGYARRGAAARPGAGGSRRRRAPSSRRSWFRPKSRTSGRCTSISPSSPRRPSGWRGSGCGAGLRSPPSCSRCSGRSPACNAGPSMVGPHAFHVIAGFVLAALLVVCGFMFGPPADDGRIEPISSGSLAAYLLGATMIVLDEFPCRCRHDRVRGCWWPARWLVAWRAPAATGAVAAAALFVVVGVPRMGGSRQSGHAGAAGRPAARHRPAPPPTLRSRCISSPRRSSRPASAPRDSWRRAARSAPSSRWCGRPPRVFTPLALLIALYARIAHLDRSIPFAILAVVLAAAFGAATEILTKRDNRPGLAISIALFATGTLGALALALTFALEKGWLTIALALMSMGTAWISMQRPIPFLRSLAAILAGIVVLRIGYEPRIVGDAVGTTPIFNWLLLGYGIPALSFWIGSIFLRRRGDDAPLRAVESAAILFTVLLAFMEIRHAVNGGDVYRASAGLTETALQVCVAARDGDRPGAAADPHRQHRSQCQRGPADGFRRTGRCVRAVVAGQSHDLADQCRRRLHQPASCSAMPCRRCWRCCCPMRWQAGAAPPMPIPSPAGALVLALTYRDARNPQALSRPDPDRRRDQRRRAIHLFDRLAGVRRGAARDRHRRQFAARPAGLGRGHRADDPESVPDRHVDADGVYRALSFMCLGLVLVAIGWLYQRILFRRQAPPLAGPAVQTEG